jgi:hypothetical protein
MNLFLLIALADSRCRAIRGEAAWRRTFRPHPRARPARGERRWSRVRRRAGYALVEAGLHLLATTGPAPGPRTSSLQPRT